MCSALYRVERMKDEALAVLASLFHYSEVDLAVGWVRGFDIIAAWPGGQTNGGNLAFVLSYSGSD